MTVEKMISVAVAYADISQAELARRIGTTPSNLNQKIKRDTLTKSDLENIAAALGCELVFQFTFPDGTTIK